MSVLLGIRFCSIFFFALLLSMAPRAVFADGVTISWDANVEADLGGYIVHYGDTSQVYQSQVDVHNITTLDIDNLTSGRTYYFVVQAYSTDGTRSPFSSEVSATVGPLGQSVFTVAVGSDGHLLNRTLMWKPVANAQAYYLYVGTRAGATDVVNSGETMATSYLLPSMNYEQTYFARIHTKQGGQWRSSDLIFKPSEPGVPTVPRSTFTTTVGSDGHLTSTTLSWSTVSDAQAYYLYVGATPGAKNIVNSGEIQATSYRLPALPSDTMVHARIYTKQASVWSYSELSFLPLHQALPARLLSPVSGQANVTSAQKFEWNRVPEAQAYYLYVGTTSGGKDIVNTGEIAATSLTVSALPAGRHLYARIWTKLQGVWYSREIEFDSAANAVLTYPYQHASDISTAETFTWTRISDAQSYRLMVGTSAGASDIADSGATTASSFKVDGLAAGQNLHATVATLIAGAWSADAVTFTTSLSARFTNPGSGDGSDLGQGIAWTTIEGAEAYFLNIGTEVGTKNLVDHGPLDTTVVETPALPAGQPLFLRMGTKRNGEWKERDTTVTLVGAALKAPFADASGKATVVRNGQLFTWTTITNAEAYYLGVGYQPGAKNVVDSGEMQGTSYQATTLPIGVRLYVSVWTKVNGVWNVTASSFVTR